MSKSYFCRWLLCIFPLLFSLSLASQEARFIIPRSYGKYWPSEAAWELSGKYAVSPRLVDYLLDWPKPRTVAEVEDSLRSWSSFLYAGQAAGARRPALLRWVELLDEQDWEWQEMPPWLGAPPELFVKWVDNLGQGEQLLPQLQQQSRLYQRLEQSLLHRRDTSAHSALRHLRAGSANAMLKSLKRAYEAGGAAAAAHDYALALDYLGRSEEVGPLYRIAIGKAPDSSRFLLSFGEHLEQEGRFQEARLMFNKAAAPDSVIARSYRMEGYAMLNRKRLQPPSARRSIPLGYDRSPESVALLKQALEAEKNSWSKVNPQRMDRYWEMGQLHKYVGLNTSAIKYIEQALKQSRKLYGRRNPYVPGLLDDLASTYASLGQAIYAEKLYKRALRKDERLLRKGMPYPGLAVRYNNIGSLYLREGDMDEALERLRAAKKIMPRFFGADHAYMKTIYQNLYNIYLHKGMAAYQEGDYRSARSIWQRSLDAALEDKPRQLTSLNNIGAAFKKLGRCDSALVYLNRALNLADAPLEPLLDVGFEYHTADGFELARTYFHRADCLLKQGKEEAALRIARRLKRWAQLNNEEALLKDLRRAGFR